MHGSNNVRVDPIQAFPKTEQNCLVESLDLTDLSNLSLNCMRTRLDEHITVTGRNMPELREICLRCTDPNLKDKSTFDDHGLYHLFGGFFEEERAMPLLKLEILDLRGTAVTGEGMDLLTTGILFYLLIYKKYLLAPLYNRQCFGSRSELDPDSIRLADPDSESDPDPEGQK
jgi:hypothetical protein